MHRALVRSLPLLRGARRAAFRTGDLLAWHREECASGRLASDARQEQLVRQFEKLIFLLGRYKKPAVPKFELCRLESDGSVSIVGYFSSEAEGLSAQSRLAPSVPSAAAAPEASHFLRPLMTSSFFSSSTRQGSKRALPGMTLRRLPTEVHYGSSEEAYVPQALSAASLDANVLLKPASAVLCTAPLSGVPRSLYVWGNVGTGKTLLMNRFFEAAPLSSKESFHFHDFMKLIHSEIHRYKQSHPTSEGDAIVQVARSIGERVTLLCFDEFQVNDIADALILGRVFETLFKSGTVLVSTSNQSPDNLYAGGLNHHIFAPFVSLVKYYSRIFAMESETDYRYYHHIPASDTYLSPLTPATEGSLQSLLPARGCLPVILPIGRTRSMPVQQYGPGIGLVPFSVLCEEDRSAIDYISLSQEYHTLVIDGVAPLLSSGQVPRFSVDRPFVVQRFVILVDHLYDRHVKAVFRAQAPVAPSPGAPSAQIDDLFEEILTVEPEQSWAAAAGCSAIERNRDFALERLRFQCVRTKSRMFEMTSQAYSDRHRARFQFA